jgi:hypothetical protein
MPPAIALLDQLWADYAAMNQQVGRIRRLLGDRGETVINDHIALRTFDDEKINIDVISRPFVGAGYRAIGEYQFKPKKLHARYFEHTDSNLPRVFISELELGECSQSLRKIIATLIEHVDCVALPGRPWNLTDADYQQLAEESEYAAWVSAFGFRANHFTVLVNGLKTFDSLEALNTFLI